MPTRKISDNALVKVCRHPDHNPPSMMYFEPGLYEHECPECLNTVTFRVNGHNDAAGNVSTNDITTYVKHLTCANYVPVHKIVHKD